MSSIDKKERGVIDLQKILLFILSIIASIAIFVGYNNYFSYKAYNVGSFVFISCTVLLVTLGIFEFIHYIVYYKFSPVAVKVVIGMMLTIFAVSFVFTSKIFHYEKYRELAGEIKTHEFKDDISVVDISKLPILTSDGAKKIADKKIGEMTSLGSQMTIGELNMQIVNDTLYYVAPLEYTGFLKWKNNKGVIPGYIMVNAQKDNEATLVRELNGKPIEIKYSKNNYFSGNIYRKVFNENKYKELSNYTFEIDDKGNPYWVVSVLEKTIFSSGYKTVGVLTVNAQTGETKEYNIKNAPKWIDRIQPLEIVNENLNNWGTLIHGVFNFSKKDTLKTTDGYKMIYNDGIGYYYTGITSVGNDESLVGFILTDTRTGKSNMYKVNGAIESSAMQSAQGKVQEKELNANYPVLINIQNKPTYFMSMIDNAGLIKGYSFVNVENYNLVGFGEDIQDAFSNYVKLLGKGKANLSNSSKKEKFEGVIDRIGAKMSENQLYYTVVLNGNKDIFIVPDNFIDVTVSNVGDNVEIEYIKNEDNIVISNFKNKSLIKE